MDFLRRHICEPGGWKHECLASRCHSGRTRCLPACVCDQIGELRTSRIPSKHLHSTSSRAKRAITYRSLFHSIASLITDGGTRARRSRIWISARSGASRPMLAGLRCRWRMARNSPRGGSWWRAESVRLRASRQEFAAIPSALASHTSEHKDLGKFKGQRVVVIGAGQSALESAALFKELGIPVEVIARTNHLNWVGLHARLHHLGLISKMMYSKRDVGPAGISRLVAMPHLFRRFPRVFQDRTAYRAIRPAGAGWLQPRIAGIPITLGRKVVSAAVAGSQLRLKLDDGSERLVDHALLATGFRVDVSRYPFLSPSLSKQVKTVNGYPVLKRGLESSIPGLHFVGKPAAWSFGPLLGFVSGAEFASTELVRSITRRNGSN